MDPPRITIFSTPLISTWVLDETHRILFDVGDGAAAMLEGKIHKANIVALTHAHRDHIAGLPQVLNLRGGMAAENGDPLKVIHPDGSGSFMSMARFLSRFDQATSGKVQWQQWKPGSQIELDDGRFLRAYATRHVACPDPDRNRSLGYQIGRQVERLRPELRSMPQSELDLLRKAGGREAITVREEEILFTLTGDTAAMTADTLGGCRFLLHECTFLDVDEARVSEAKDRGHEHSYLSEVLDLAEMADVERLGLYHISKRYTDDEIVKAVRAGCAKRDLKCRVSIALPGRLYVDLFSQAVWPGKN